MEFESNLRRFAMITERIHVALLGAAVVLLPSLLIAQDPNANLGSSPYSQTSPSMNQPGGTGMNSQTGQSSTPGMQQSGQPSSMHDSLGAPGQTGQEMMDKQFVRNAAESGITDEQLGKLATVKGSPAVQTLAQKLVDDHAASNKDLDTVADSLGIMLPKKMNKDHQKEYEKLNGLSGKDFDTEYLTFIATEHYQDLHVFHMEASVAANQDLSAEVVKEMGTMHQHLGLIQNTAKDEGIALPPRPQRPGPATASK
jgi:putative membrane protein